MRPDSLMNAGKVLACDAPQKLIEARGAAILRKRSSATWRMRSPRAPPVRPGKQAPAAAAVEASAHAPRSGLSLRLGRLLAYTATKPCKFCVIRCGWPSLLSARRC